MILTHKRQVQSAVANDDGLRTALARILGLVPQVRHVMAETAEGVTVVWIAVDDPQPDVRRAIYQKELEIIDAFPDVDFDFNLVPSMGRPPADIVTDAAVVYSRPE